MRNLRLDVFTEDECAEIYMYALRVLEEVGSDISNEHARTLLLSAGCEQDGKNIKIPSSLVEKARSTAPKTIIIYDRNGDPDLTLNARSGGSYIVPGMVNLFRSDYETNIKHRTVEQDAYEAGLVIEALPNIDVASGLTFIADCDTSLASAHELRTLLKTTRKPVLIMNDDVDELKVQMDLFAAVAGDIDTFVKHPFVIAGAPSTPPLTHQDDVLERLLYMFEMGIPTPYVSAPMIGVSSPASISGGCVIGLAETLVGLVLSQLTRPGNPFMGTTFMDSMDMKGMNFTQTGPEFTLGSAASGSIFRYLDIPFCVHLGCTDSPIFDQQAAADITSQLYSGLLCGANLIYFSGYLEAAMSSSLEVLTFCDEIAGMLKHIVAGERTTDELIAFDSIADVGPGGSFLMEDLTIERCHDFWEPKLFVRQDLDAWNKEGSRECGMRAHEMVQQIIAEGIRNPLPEEIANRLDKIIADADKTRA